jgi:DNA-binding XRE family transcriptional regulator
MAKVTSLREARAEQLLTIRELAQLANVAPSTVYLVEAGRTVPRLAIVRRLTAVLRVQPHQIAEFASAIEASKRPAGFRRARRAPPTAPTAGTHEGRTST